ncbi:MAG: hypothetical protein ACJ76H_11155, partial [Bacteriovoracaceae bacterium]
MAETDCIRVNADYESELFHGRPGPIAVNRALEFLAFYLQDLPVQTSAEYTQEFFDHVRKISGRDPKIVRTGNSLNWWGPLVRPEKERWLNSKLTSAKLSISEGWSETRILHREEIEKLLTHEELLVKDPFSMSGKGIVTLKPGQKIHLPNALQGELIVEPLLKRSHDFSHYVFPDGKVIRYENLVDERFQYRGTVIADELSFADEVEKTEWTKFESRLKKIIHHYGKDSLYGYSVDSFVYEKNGEFLIYPLCEVNARRTMGRVAWEFSQLLGKGRKTALTLKQPLFKDAIRL